ncbi:hypothetical protein AMAG_19697 [Allomyces macrogynus ATCC 38327]|uniref:Uncharacterized protein n=1 Tax=Allomyces macrogynus (strain ATCC 38327) TaxID=578462 RepID=A0A0L0SZ94_ALLM3|nr:hypothetical protein AMAG_19697 [Allomyces macrogynus ATCC 38327]|eukprot:KNE67730.1 hypothetical protein AMAG_19697 [Allomyces macrogynus ATCC 38327]
MMVAHANTAPTTRAPVPPPVSNWPGQVPPTAGLDAPNRPEPDVARHHPVRPYLGPPPPLPHPTTYASAHDTRAIEFLTSPGAPAGPGPPPPGSWWPTTAPPTPGRPAATFSTVPRHDDAAPAPRGPDPSYARGANVSLVHDPRPPHAPLPGTYAHRRAIDTLDIARMRSGGAMYHSAPRRAMDTLEIARMQAHAAHAAAVAAPGRTWVPDLAHRDRPTRSGR